MFIYFRFSPNKVEAADARDEEERQQGPPSQPRVSNRHVTNVRPANDSNLPGEVPHRTSHSHQGGVLTIAPIDDPDVSRI